MTAAAPAITATVTAAGNGGGSTPIINQPCTGGSSCPGNAFADMPKPSNWTHAGIDYAVENGLFNGMSATTFEPGTAMNRAMLVTVLWRYEGEPTAGTNTFTDVPNGKWSAKAITWASANGIVNGVSEGKFDPMGNTTRAQVATIMMRFIENIVK